jgi:hypothetical protein
MAPRRPPAKPRGKPKSGSPKKPARAPVERRRAAATPSDTSTHADLERLAAEAALGDHETELHQLAMRKRLKRCLELLETGMLYSRVMEAIQSEFNVVQRTAERDLARAYEAIAAEEETELKSRAARCGRALWRVAHKAEAEGDYRGAIAGYGRLATVLGMDKPREIKVSGGMTLEQRALLDALQLTPAEREKEIAELRAAAGIGAVIAASESDDASSEPDDEPLEDSDAY